MSNFHVERHDLANQLAEELSVEVTKISTTSDVFGCEVDLLHPDTQEPLQDPMWNTLQVNACFNPVVRVMHGGPPIQATIPRERMPETSGVIPDSAFIQSHDSDML